MTRAFQGTKRLGVQTCRSVCPAGSPRFIHPYPPPVLGEPQPPLLHHAWGRGRDPRTGNKGARTARPRAHLAPVEVLDDGEVQVLLALPLGLQGVGQELPEGPVGPFQKLVVQQERIRGLCKPGGRRGSRQDPNHLPGWGEGGGLATRRKRCFLPAPLLSLPPLLFPPFRFPRRPYATAVARLADAPSWFKGIGVTWLVAGRSPVKPLGWGCGCLPNGTVRKEDGS